MEVQDEGPCEPHDLEALSQKGVLGLQVEGKRAELV